MHETHTPPQGATLTPAEAMAVLGISRSTLNRYVDSNRLPSRKLPSGHRRFAEADVAALLAQQPWQPAESA